MLSDPGGGSKVWEALDGAISESGKNRSHQRYAGTCPDALKQPSAQSEPKITNLRQETRNIAPLFRYGRLSYYGAFANLRNGCTMSLAVNPPMGKRKPA
jgi:hypothetical protein